jgi:hypothetical protein
MVKCRKAPTLDSQVIGILFYYVKVEGISTQYPKLSNCVHGGNFVQHKTLSHQRQKGIVQQKTKVIIQQKPKVIVQQKTRVITQ